MRKMLKNQTGRTESKKKAADRRRMDSQIRRTERRALRRSRKAQEANRGLVKLWVDTFLTWNPTPWQKQFLAALEGVSKSFSSFARLYQSYPRREGKSDAIRRVEAMLGPAETGPREAQYDYAQESEARRRQTRAIFDELSEERYVNELEFQKKAEEKAALSVRSPKLPLKF